MAGFSYSDVGQVDFAVTTGFAGNTHHAELSGSMSKAETEQGFEVLGFDYAVLWASGKAGLVDIGPGHSR